MSARRVGLGDHLIRLSAAVRQELGVCRPLVCRDDGLADDLIDRLDTLLVVADQKFRELGIGGQDRASDDFHHPATGELTGHAPAVPRQDDVVGGHDDGV